MIGPLLLSTLLLLPADEKGGVVTHVSIGAYIAASSMDLASTMYCVGAQTCHEINPFLKPFEHAPLAFGLVKGAASAAVAYALVRLHRQHPRLTRVLALGLTAGSTYVALRNARTVGR